MLFIETFGEVNDEESLNIYPYLRVIGDTHLKLFYKFLWWKLRCPTIDDFGKRFFLELCDTKFQIHLLKLYMNHLLSLYQDL